MREIKVTSVSTEELVRIIKEAVASAIAEQGKNAISDATGMSLAAAAKLAGRRRKIVADAMACGTLPARRVGKPGPLQRWKTTASAVKKWVEDGCPGPF